MLLSVSHVGVCNLGYWCEVEDDGEAKDKGSDAKVSPLDAGKVLGIDIGEEDAGCKERGNYRSDGLEGLREVEAELRVSRRTT